VKTKQDRNIRDTSLFTLFVEVKTNQKHNIQDRNIRDRMHFPTLFMEVKTNQNRNIRDWDTSPHSFYGSED
jgi:hypothetical protein